MPRKLVSLILVLIDMGIVSFVPFMALFIRFDGNVGAQYYTQLLSYLPIIITVRLITFYFFRLYHRLWRYASIHEMLVVIAAVTVSSAVLFGYIQFVGTKVPRSVEFLSWFFNIAFIGGSRMGVRILRCLMHRNQNQQLINVLIVGAGDAGATIAREIKNRYYETKRLVGFIDDSEYKSDLTLFGARVLGTCEDVAEVVAKYDVHEIIIAMPSVNGSILRNIIHACQATKCAVKILPGIYELIDGKVTVQQLRNVDLEDLLRRDPIKLDLTKIAGYLAGKRVLVTGAGGSIGSELCRQIAKIKPTSLTLLGKGENSIYEIDRELREKYPDLAISPVIADVRDNERINDIFNKIKPQVIFHAAAHKHVPLMEAQPAEAVRNNIFGTKTVAEAADRVSAEIFIMISTDKAVNPTSVMGATKRVAELIIQHMNDISSTKFAAVRFGNVLGSRGSVVPLFKKQIAKGGPITITHPDMKRYFMTIPEACQLVLQAGSMANGGEVFVLDMGEPVKIMDMASDLIELSGLIPDKDIKLKFTGLRPGEKLFEELLTAEEGTASTKHEKIYQANLKKVNGEKLEQHLNALHGEVEAKCVRQILSNLVPTYHQSQAVLDKCIKRDEHLAENIREYQPAVSG